MPDSFADSNVLLYLLSRDEAKRARALEIIEAGATVSVQVLNEITSVARRKHQLGWDVVGSFVDDLLPLVSVKSLTLDTHLAGRAVAERYGFSFYDSLIIAAALEAGCETLFSEDLQDGQQIGAMRVVNPFV